MAGADLKTQPTAAVPEDFIHGMAHPKRRADALVLLDFFNKVTGLKPRMWGPGIVGYGRYHYRYDSGREGEFFLTGFSPRKASLTLYCMPGFQDVRERLQQLGKHKTGKSCLYINKLEDVDMKVLEQIIRHSLKYMRAKYKTWDE